MLYRHCLATATLPEGDGRYRRNLNGALYDERGQLVFDSLRNSSYADVRHVAPSYIFPHEYADVPLFRGKYFYCGHFHGHFGHFLIETLPELYRARTLMTGGKYLFHPFEWQSARVNLTFSYVQEALSLLGISPDELSFVEHDCVVEAVEVHPRRVVPNHSMDDSCVDVYRFMAGRVEAARGCGEKIFMSRSRIPDSRGNEPAFDAQMQQLGYTVIHPEELPLREQIAVVKSARTLAGFDGSALHLSVFMAAGGVVEIIGNRCAVNTVNCNRLSGQETRRIQLT
jgi:capsular polysaccharide biosynthesis protein